MNKNAVNPIPNIAPGLHTFCENPPTTIGGGDITLDAKPNTLNGVRAMCVEAFGKDNAAVKLVDADIAAGLIDPDEVLPVDEHTTAIPLFKAALADPEGIDAVREAVDKSLSPELMEALGPEFRETLIKEAQEELWSQFSTQFSEAIEAFDKDTRPFDPD